MDPWSVLIDQTLMNGFLSQHSVENTSKQTTKKASFLNCLYLITAILRNLERVV